jgi:hypothetical protein
MKQLFISFFIAILSLVAINFAMAEQERTVPLTASSTIAMPDYTMPGTLTVTGSLTDAQNNKYSTSTSGGGSNNATGTAGQVGIFNATNTLNSSNYFTFASTTALLETSGTGNPAITIEDFTPTDGSSSIVMDKFGDLTLTGGQTVNFAGPSMQFTPGSGEVTLNGTDGSSINLVTQVGAGNNPNISFPPISGTLVLGTATTTGNCVSWLNTSTIQSTGSPCGSGVSTLNNLTGGVIATGTTNQIAVSSSTGSVVISIPNTLTVPGTLNVSQTSTFTGRVGIGTTQPSSSLMVQGQITDGIYDATSTTPSTTINFLLAERQKVNIGEATTTIYLTNVTNWGNDLLTVCQDGTGSRTVTWAVSSTNAATTVDWGMAGTPTLSTGANKCDKFSFAADPTDTNQASTTVSGAYGPNGFGS